MMIETKRLLIRPSTIEDAFSIHSFLSDPDTMSFFVEGTYSLKQVQDILLQNQSDLRHYTLVEHSTNQVI